MSTIIEKIFREWTNGKNPKEARIAIFDRIKDIPYSVIPSLNDPQTYIEMLSINKGSCTPKHFLLCAMFQMLDLPVLYAVYQYRWNEFEYLYPREMKNMANKMPVGNHLACKVEIEGKLILVDATLDSPLSALGLPVNKSWDGIHNTLLPIVPCNGETLYAPSEADLVQKPIVDGSMQRFYDSLNSWLESVRLHNK